MQIVNVDENLVAKAQALLHATSADDAAHLLFTRFIEQNMPQHGKNAGQKILDLAGKIDIDDDYRDRRTDRHSRWS